MSANPTTPDQNPVHEAAEAPLADWESRKRLAHLLYDRGEYQKAADTIWGVEEIPNIDIELAFAARILAKASPRKSIRLLTALLEHNKGKAVQNLGLANALLHHGMVLQAARFYGAALEADPTLCNPDLEHFILWIDDEEKLWGDFKRRRPQLGELPWMRDPKMALELTNRVSLHTTPIKLPGLNPVAGEELRNELYLQEPLRGMQPTPPPAVTIPMDRVDPKHRRFDQDMGAATEVKAAAASVPTAKPVVPAPAPVVPAPVVPAPSSSLPTPSVMLTPSAVAAPPRPSATAGAELAKPNFWFDKKPPEKTQ